MRFDKVLAMETGSVVCVENGATITVSGKGDEKRFKPDRPEGAPAMAEYLFTQQYSAKHFKIAPQQTAKGASK